MKLPRPGSLSLLLLSLTLGSCTSARGAPEPEAERPGQRLLGKLKVLADSGRLHDRAFVVRTLGMELAGSSLETVEQPAKCESPYSDRSRIVSTLKPAAGSWLRPTADGVASLEAYGPWQDQPVVISGPTELDYSVAIARSCSDLHRRRLETEADLKISRVQAFACISSTDLETWLPGVEVSIDHHAETVAYYRGREYPDRRASISFRFSYTRCVTDITVHQRPDQGSRYRAAEQRQRQCMLPHQAEYCRTHPPFGWEHGWRQDEMDRFAVAKCGTFERFYKSTPKDARPRELPHRRAENSTPCGDVLAELSGSK